MSYVIALVLPRQMVVSGLQTRAFMESGPVVAYADKNCETGYAA